MMNYTLTFILAITSTLCCGQAILRGKVINEKTKEPLAFASIVIEDSRGGTRTDIDGRFQLTLPDDRRDLIFTHIGFESRTIHITDASSFLILRLKEKSTELAEVVVHPEDNPAFRIIRTATKNKPLHDPE